MKIQALLILAMLTLSCSSDKSVAPNQGKIRFEKISFFKFPKGPQSKPFQSRLMYYFDNGKPHRWLELDSVGKVLVDYIYHYDSEWNHIGAKYKESDEIEYSTEKVTYENDSTKITEWVDSVGNVIYTMTDHLNKDGKTYRATFKADRVHGYDSTFYTAEGFQQRIFFTNTKGEIFNDRIFRYDSIDTSGEWVIRKKIMEDTIRELHIRKIRYDSSFVTAEGVFYEGILSTTELSENSISFTKKEDLTFQTRTTNWDNQSGYLSQKRSGLFNESVPLEILSNIYNGAISPSGDKIIYCTKKNGIEQVMLLKKVNNSWLTNINLTQRSNIEGGYFYWLTEKELYFYVPANGGDIVKGQLDHDHLVITDSLKNLNTPSGTEFSPFVDKEMRFIIFTRYTEGEESQQGFFVSYNMADAESPVWSNPEKLDMLPYGWNAYIINAGSQFIYSNGDDIFSLPTANLGLKITP